MPRSIAFLLFVVASQAQNYPPPFPRDGARKLIENDRLVVWDVVWQKGRPSPMHEHRFDQISVTLVGGTVRITRLDGSSTVNQSELGSVTLTARGTVHSEEGVSDIAQHKIMVELKSSATQALPSTNDAPGAPPIEGAVKQTENDRVVAWDYAWKPGQQIARNAEAHDCVWIFLEGGTIRSTTTAASGKFTAATRQAGQAVYAPATREAYTEEAVEGTPRAIILEIK